MIIGVILDFVAVLICGSFAIAHICNGDKVPAIITFGLALINLFLLITNMIIVMKI